MATYCERQGQFLYEQRTCNFIEDKLGSSGFPPQIVDLISFVPCPVTSHVPAVSPLKVVHQSLHYRPRSIELEVTNSSVYETST